MLYLITINKIAIAVRLTALLLLSGRVLKSAGSRSAGRGVVSGLCSVDLHGAGSLVAPGEAEQQSERGVGKRIGEQRASMKASLVTPLGVRCRTVTNTQW